MATPTVSTLYAQHQSALPFQMRQFLGAPGSSGLGDTINDDYYRQRTGNIAELGLPKPYELRYHDESIGQGDYVNVFCDGPCWFRWCLNRSGGTLAQFALVSRPAQTTGLVVVTGTVSSATLAAATLVATEEEDCYVHVYDDAGGANAAPEGEVARIVRNLEIAGVSSDLHWQPDFTVAVAVGDVLDIFRPHFLENAADGDTAESVQGVVLADGGIEDDCWGWICCRGNVFTAKIAGAVAIGDAVVADAAAVGPSGADADELFVGKALTRSQAAATRHMIHINTMEPHYDNV